ncbi:MAG: DUF2924 domain-containing protein [Pseudomonadota bacterium]
MQLDDLAGLSRDQLVALWERAYKCPPPKGVRRRLLEHSSAWHIQARSSPHLVGRVKSELKRRMNEAHRLKQPCVATASADGGERGKGARSSAPPMGTRLIREWNGRTYIVDVTAEGFVMDGNTFRSLTAVARRITGTHWSGPRFFGL